MNKDQDQDKEGNRAQGLDTFANHDRDHKGESGYPLFTSLNSLVNTTNHSPTLNDNNNDMQQGSQSKR